MIIGSHVIISAYGFWLPNDPRGSWSQFVGAWELLRFGKATKVSTRRSVAGAAHNYPLRVAAKKALKYRPVHFNGLQARAIGRGFAAFARDAGLTVWACAILPEHTHLVLAAHARCVEPLINHMKGKATCRLITEGIHPLASFATRTGLPPKAWARGLWKVFLNDPAEVVRAVRYVEGNPMKEGLPPQRWSFVRPYNPPA
jgi:REP element-mobilizing transposase RayT